MNTNDVSQRSCFRLECTITSAVGIAAIGLLLAGCAHSYGGGGGRFTAGEGFSRAETPSILAGPVSVLLTNMEGFSAHVTVMQNGATRTNGPALSGKLVAQQGHLFWTPTVPNSSSRKAAAHNFSFMWDVNQNSGYILSEALQGYAPVSSSLRYTNLVTTLDSEGSSPETLQGHRCAPVQVTVLSNDGTAHSFKTWQAADLNRFPLKIVPVGDIGSTILLSQVRPERSPGDAFEPPPGFTRYESGEAMVNEVMLRQREMKRPLEGGNVERGTDNRRGRRPGASW